METDNSRKSPYEQDNSVFSEKVLKAAGNGGIRNAQPFIRHLNQHLMLCAGLADLLNIVTNNHLVAENYDPADNGSIPPLSPSTTHNLLTMATEVCHMMVSEVHHVADWAEKHAITKGGA